jgi:hypothetical protein
MRKSWVVLLTMGLIMALAIPVCAADVKFSGQYYVQGIYDHNRSLKDNAAGDGSTAFIAQRLRVKTEFKVAEGLSLVTRFDALEKKWGDNTWGENPNYDSVNRSQNRTPQCTFNSATSAVSCPAKNSRTQENIEFEQAYVDFNTAIGRFLIGYQDFDAFGTSFGDSNWTRPGIKYMLSIGNTTIIAAMEQTVENSSTPTVSPTNQGLATDGDKNTYDLAVVQKFQGGDAGLLIQYFNDSSRRDASNVRTKAYFVNPYVKATFGPIYVEAEVLYGGGKYAEYESGVTTPDVDLRTWNAYIGAKGTFGPAYVGAMFAWMQGDDPKSASEKEGNVASYFTHNKVFSPCLILFSDEYYTWMGGLRGYGASTTTDLTNYMDNVWFYSLYGGYKPIPKLDIRAAVYYAYADEKPTSDGLPPSPTNPRFVDRVYGTEFDLTAKYKIYDNLEYMIGFAYLWTGDYFKGTNEANKVANDYMVTHKLTLNF